MENSKRVLYIVPIANHTMAEDKLLSLAKAGQSNNLFEPLFIFVSKNPFQQVLNKYQISFREVQGYVGLAKFLQKENYSAVHFYGPEKLAEVIATNVRNNLPVIFSSFDKKIPNSKHISKIKIAKDSLGEEYFIGLNKGLERNYKLTTYSTILVSAKSTEELDFEAILNLSRHLRAVGSPLKIKIFYEGELKNALKARLQAEQLTSFVDFSNTADFNFDNSFCYLDFNSKSIKLDLLEAIDKQIPVIIRNSKDNNFLFESGKFGFLFQNSNEIPNFVGACKSFNRNEIKLDQKFLINSSLENYQQLYFGNTLGAKMQNQSPTLYMIVPYSIYGGGEIYLKNHIEKRTFNNVHLVFLSGSNQFYSLMKDKVPCTILNGIHDLPLFLLQTNAKKVLFYNSGSIAKLLTRLKSNLNLHITEVVHSTLQWGDSMHNVDRRFVDKVLVVAEMVGKQWKLNRFEVLPATIDEKRFKIPKKSNDKIVVGTVARFSPEKDLKRVVDVASCLDDNYRFVIVGKDGGTKKEVEDYIRLKKLTHKIELRDYREDIEQEYARFDCFLLTSKIEGTPLTILEAKAVGIPVVVPDVGAIKEMIRKGEGRVYNSSESARNIAFYVKEVTKGKKEKLDKAIKLSHIPELNESILYNKEVTQDQEQMWQGIESEIKNLLAVKSDNLVLNKLVYLTSPIFQFYENVLTYTIRIAFFLEHIDYHHFKLTFLNFLHYDEVKKNIQFEVFNTNISQDEANNFDSFFIIRGRGDKFKESVLIAKTKKIKIVYFIDDDWTNMNESLELKNITDWFWWYLSMSDSVINGNPLLNKVLRSKITNKKILDAIQNVNLHDFEKNTSNLPTHYDLAYIGSKRIETSFLEAIEKFATNEDRARILLMGQKNQKLTNFSNITWKPFTKYEDYLSEINKINVQIALAPLASEIKAPNKYLEITALGAVGVYSNKEPYNEFITNGYNGILVENTTSAWLDAIYYLYENKSIANELIINAKRDVMNNFDTKAKLSQFLILIRDAIL